MADRPSSRDHLSHKRASLLDHMKDQGGRSKGIGAATAGLEDMLRQAGVALQNRRPDEAERIARQLLAKSAQNVGARHVLGLACLAQGRASEAVATLEQAAAVGANAVIETHLAIALRQVGRSSEALAWLRRATGRKPTFAFAFHELAALLVAQRRPDEAEAVIKQGLEEAPTMPELSILLGAIYLDRAERTDAQAAFARALANAPSHPGALYGLGATLMDNGEFARAAERFRQALASDPNYFQAQLGLATCLLELGQREPALVHLRAVAQAAPPLHGKALRALSSSAYGQFFLRPSKATEFFKSKP
jgi:tetratricopeptide (TPR) repeat protein